ncbi:MAG: ABC transporter permease [Candidatus Poribacteria bacterium]|jgi:peptide/nickel transport system permease protein|nr:ABC transporter permease [Candidatus Poribacteria bacterium]MDP6747151.1 ABC transporter permease [Candidatus Poribacteria bacterium]MDP6999228.1 ABC transporter permease [Candidatus Poribacteria bacterium]
MTALIIRRIILIIPLLFIISIISFIIILLPPGSYVETYVENLERTGFLMDESQIKAIYKQYGLDRPAVVQYILWMSNFLLKGEMGRSFIYQKPVTEVIMERLPMSMAVTLISLAVTWLLAVPIGIYSALRQYSIGDYVATIIGFVGLALPNFLLALALTYLVFAKTGHAVTGLFSIEYKDAPWTVDKLFDLLGNIWLPILVIASAGTASLIRILRATLLDEKNKQYVTTARAKGLPEHKLILKYPVRVAINPLISTIGWTLPLIVSGEIIVSQTLGLETLGPVLLSAAMGEDMFLVGSIVMILSSLTVIGTLISDILLAWIDPRIRFDKVSI